MAPSNATHGDLQALAEEKLSSLGAQVEATKKDLELTNTLLSSARSESEKLEAQTQVAKDELAKIMAKITDKRSLLSGAQQNQLKNFETEVAKAEARIASADQAEADAIARQNNAHAAIERLRGLIADFGRAMEQGIAVQIKTQSKIVDDLQSLEELCPEPSAASRH